MSANAAESALVRFGEEWYEAHVLDWSEEDDGRWAVVRWRPPSGAEIRGTFPERDVRPQPA
jgi:hypothetical protein